MKDYLKDLDANLIDDAGNIRVLAGGRQVFFRQQTADVLRGIINNAMAVATSFYQDRVANSKIDIPERDLWEVSLRVVLSNLYVYNSWKNSYPKYQDLELKITIEDLKHVGSEDDCYFYCKEKYGTDYALYAAGLNGQTREQFERWEQGRIAFWNR